MSAAVDWIEGDVLGMTMPAHPEALRGAGAEFLTAAFRRFGALGADNAVARVTRFEDCPRGSTGRKVLLGVEYARPDPALHTDLFVKFSRAFDDPLRDNQRFEMADEARFAAVSAGPDFPIAVPKAYFSDFHGESGTGMMITQCIPYGQGANEPHYEKCLDWQMPDALGHYRTIVATNARLGAAHRAGALPAAVDRWFPFDRDKAIAADRIRYDARQLGNRVARFAQFCGDYPQLLPANVRDGGFHARLARDVPRFLEHEQVLREWLFGRPGSIVFAHWNANIDNAWFWKGDDGARHCGFIDWGRVGPMPVAQALWGTLSGAEVAIWDGHLDALIGVYVAAFEGLPEGPRLDAARVRLELEIQVGLLGTCWLLDAVALIQRMVPDLAEAQSKRDARFVAHEQARNQLHMLTVFMNLFERHDLGRSIDAVLARVEEAR
ncbi:MAG: phosphotransferase [Sphingomonadales bacterium]|nr:phosphotransferase [Sphingomonadales bacterium]